MAPSNGLRGELFAGAWTPSEHEAAGAAVMRIRRQLHGTGRAEPEIEIRYSIADQ